MVRSAGLVRLTAIGLVLAFGAVAHAENASNKLSANKLSANKLSVNRLSANKLAANTVQAGEGAVIDIVGVELRSGESFRR
jgi:hypothetical protein